jgi:hypothetical protein
MTQMQINEETIKKVREAYKNRFNAIIFRMAGPSSLTPEELQKLIDLGLIDPRDAEHGLIADAYTIARMRGGDHFQDREKISLKQFRQRVKSSPLILSPREQYAIEHVKRSAGNYITKLRDNMLADVEGEIRSHNYEEQNKILNDVIRPTIDEGIRSANVTVREVASRLRERTGDTYRNWKRVAVTEMSNALNLGAADAIIERNHGQSTDDVFVYKIVHMDAVTCPYCRKFYLEEDGITPKVYKMSELIANGDNYGKKANEWKPVIGATHPNERCELVEMPHGFGFEAGSNRLDYVGKDFKWYHRKK